MATSQACFLGQRYADPVALPTHRRRLARCCDHRGRNYAEAAGVPSKRLDAWAVPDPTFGVDAPLVAGVIVGVSP